MDTSDTKAWDVATAVLPHVDRVLLVGPPGTGKTYLGLHAGLQDGQEVYNVTLTREMFAYELRGLEKPVKGTMVWADGVALRAARRGARLVLNEVQRAEGDVLGFLVALLDTADSRAITLPTGETVVPAPGFTVVATMNGSADMLDEALRSRFPVTLTIPSPHPAAIAALPADIQATAAATAVQDEDRRIDLRQWQAYAILRAALDADTAAFACFGPRAEVVADALLAGGTPADDTDDTSADDEE